MTHTDLKPCPFCGSDQVTMSKAWASDSVVWVAICKACSASVDHEDEASAAKAWNTRAPDTAPSQSADLIAELERNATWRDDRYQCVTSPDLLRRAATALRAAEAENARLREYPTWVMEQEEIVKPWLGKFFGLGPHPKGPTHVDPLPIHAIWGFFGRARRALGGRP